VPRLEELKFLQFYRVCISAGRKGSPESSLKRAICWYSRYRLTTRNRVKVLFLAPSAVKVLFLAPSDQTGVRLCKVFIFGFLCGDSTQAREKRLPNFPLFPSKFAQIFNHRIRVAQLQLSLKDIKLEEYSFWLLGKPWLSYFYADEPSLIN